MTVRIIAEIGSVHDGSFGNACKLIELAAACGADVVKFQTHIAEEESLADAPSPGYFSAEPRMDYFRRTAFSADQWRDLMAVAREHEIGFISSPFSIAAVEFLDVLGIDFFKIPSGEVTNIPMLEAVAATGREVFLSSGMSDWAELDAAVNALSASPLSLMQCSSAYPCPPEKVGLNVISEMRERYGVPVGYSDHTLGIAAPVAAVTLGANSIEKHLTFSKAMYGSDARHSAEPGEFRAMVDAIREVERMLASPVNKASSADYRDMKQIFEKSLVTARTMKAGERFEAADFAYKKPGDGIPAADVKQFIGRSAVHDMPADHKLAPGDFR